jgi:hypothetical protein
VASDKRDVQRLSAAWNALDAELTALWEKSGKPSGKAWKKIAQPLCDRMEANEDALGPALWKWANEQEPRLSYEYSKIRKATGLKMNGHRMRALFGRAANEEAKASLDDMARTMPDDEWDSMMGDFCTLTPEGQATKDYLEAARAKVKEEDDSPEAIARRISEIVERDYSPLAIVRRVLDKAADDPSLSKRERASLKMMARDDLPENFRSLLRREIARDLGRLGYTGLRKKRPATTNGRVTTEAHRRRGNRWTRQDCIDALRVANFPSARGYERWRASAQNPAKWPTRHTIMDELGGGLKPAPAYPGQTGRHAVGASWEVALQAARP